MDDPFTVIRELDGATLDRVITELQDRLATFKTLRAVRRELLKPPPPEVPTILGAALDRFLEPLEVAPSPVPLPPPVEPPVDIKSPKKLRNGRLRIQILEYLRGRGPDTIIAIAVATNSTYQQVYTCLYNAMGAGLVEKVGKRWKATNVPIPNDEYPEEEVA